MNNDTKQIRVLLDKCEGKIDVTYEDAGWSPLAWAASHGNAEIVRILLASNGASIYAVSNEDVRNPDGLPTATATEEGKKAARQHPLLWAAFRGHLEVVWLLLDPQHGLSAASTDFIGNTALHQAAAGGSLAVVECILSCDNVDVMGKNKRGHMALDLATDRGVCELLQRAMNTRMCEVTRSEFSYLVLRVRCMACRKFLSSPAMAPVELKLHRPDSTVAEKPRRCCLQCHAEVEGLERGMRHAKAEFVLQSAKADEQADQPVDIETKLTAHEAETIRLLSDILLRTESKLVCPKLREDCLVLKACAAAIASLKRASTVPACHTYEAYRVAADGIAEAIRNAEDVVNQTNVKYGLVVESRPEGGISIPPASPLAGDQAGLATWLERAARMQERLLVEAALTRSVEKVLGPKLRSFPLVRTLNPDLSISDAWPLMPSAARLDAVFLSLLNRQIQELKRVLPEDLSDTQDYHEDGSRAPVFPASRLATQPAPGQVGIQRPGVPDRAAAPIAHRPTSEAATQLIVMKPLELQSRNLQFHSFECTALDNARDLLLRAERASVALDLMADVEDVVSRVNKVAHMPECQPAVISSLTFEKRDALELPAWHADILDEFPAQVGELKDLLRKCKARDVPVSSYGKLEEAVKLLDQQLCTLRRLTDETKFKGEFKKWKASKVKK